MLSSQQSFCTGQIVQKRRSGFSLVEATLSIGLLSFGFLTLIPLLALGMKSARLARDDRATALIAQTLTEEVRQGVVTKDSTLYVNLDGAPCASPQAAYSIQLALQKIDTLSHWTLRITPVGAPDRARTYAVVIPTP